jgi:hypothetical protein
VSVQINNLQGMSVAAGLEMGSDSGDTLGLDLTIDGGYSVYKCNRCTASSGAVPPPTSSRLWPSNGRHTLAIQVIGTAATFMLDGTSVGPQVVVGGHWIYIAMYIDGRTGPSEVDFSHLSIS